MENNGHFTLDSDEDEIREEENVAKERLAIVEMGVNARSFTSVGRNCSVNSKCSAATKDQRNTDIIRVDTSWVSWVSDSAVANSSTFILGVHASSPAATLKFMQLGSLFNG
ncbi:hypothetical protein GH714_035346 [Hevea brasiliensis]|uniref:Uncharacterized protein n=1 Tax=Hevea brasiliensis TaxID=3981 RepID=A0A6A6NB55_HEVBR|nr:hypothetical protein GH714_035346 [Hevea brasiliensis]